MSDENDPIEAWVRANRDYFAELNDYNAKVISFGYIAFFSLAAFVRESAPPKPFIWAMALMSLSVAIFVLYEIMFIYLTNRYASDLSKAIENLPDDSILNSVNDAKLIWEVRLQKWNALFLLSSLTFAVFSLILLFYCYWVMLLS